MILACVSVPYLGSYAYLSERGRYEVNEYSWGGLIHLGWFPEGFHSKWQVPLTFIYFPLLYLDWELWHPTIRASEKTTFPVDVEDINDYKRMIKELRKHYSQDSN